MTLMQRLIAAGYPPEEMDHHESDLYVYMTPRTKRVIDQWLKDNCFSEFFVEKFTDQITGRPMYSIAFQYDPYWEAVADSTALVAD